MTPTSETLSAQTAQLTPKERIQVVERILNSLDQPDAALDVLWANPRWPPKFPRLWPPQTPPPELIGDRG